MDSIKAKKTKTVTIKRQKATGPKVANKPPKKEGVGLPNKRQDEWRDKLGRFAPGNKAGGRLPRVMEKEYAEIFRQEIPPEKFRQMLQVLLDKALSGNMLAITKILEYAIGRPKKQLVMEEQSSIRYAGMSPVELKGKMVERVMNLLVAAPVTADSEARSQQHEMITVRKRR